MEMNIMPLTFLRNEVKGKPKRLSYHFFKIQVWSNMLMVKLPVGQC